jgi:hypothetical protein
MRVLDSPGRTGILAAMGIVERAGDGAGAAMEGGWE